MLQGVSSLMTKRDEPLVHLAAGGIGVKPRLRNNISPLRLKGPRPNLSFARTDRFISNAKK